MYRFAGLIMASILVAGCATTSRSANSPEDPGEAKENALKKAYKDCVAKEGKTAANCKKIKDDLYEQMEWNLLDRDS